MKAKITLLLILFFVCFSCEKDSKSEFTKNIVGSWKLISAEPASDYEPCDYTGFITFKSDNTLLSIDACSQSNDTGLWRIIDNILTVSDDQSGLPIDILIVSMSDSNMTLKYMGGTEYYVKVPDSLAKPITIPCKMCATNTYENGNLIIPGAEKEYCGAELMAKEAIPDITIGAQSVKVECH